MTKDEILSRLLSDISDEFDKDVGSFFYDVTKPTSEEFETAYTRLEEILKNGFALTATGEYLDCKAAEQGIVRKSGIASQVKVTITGTPGSVISVGDKVASDSLIFSAIENVEIGESGTADVTVICDTVGTVGNIPQGAINRFPVTLSGIVSVTNCVTDILKRCRSRQRAAVNITMSSGQRKSAVSGTLNACRFGTAAEPLRLS